MAMKLCFLGGKTVPKNMLAQMHEAVQECAMCEALVGAVDALMEDKSIDRNVTKYISTICQTLPSGKQDKVRVNSTGHPLLLNRNKCAH